MLTQLPVETNGFGEFQEAEPFAPPEQGSIEVLEELEQIFAEPFQQTDTPLAEQVVGTISSDETAIAIDSVSKVTASEFNVAQPAEDKLGSDSEDDSNDTDYVIKDSMRQYLNGVGQEPLLTADEEVKLAQAIEKGEVAKADLEKLQSSDPGLKLDPELTVAIAAGVAARARFIRSNSLLVVSIAKKFHEPSLELRELCQAGHIGLIKAVDGFDGTKGFRFSTYATPKIWRAIKQAIENEADLIHIPRRKRDELREARKKTAEDNVALDEENARFDRLTNPYSLNRPMTTLNPGAAEFGDFIADEDDPSPEEEALTNVQRDEIAELRRNLDPKWRKAVDLRFGFTDGNPRTLEEVGEEMGIPHQYAGKLINKGLKVLRKQLVGTGR